MTAYKPRSEIVAELKAREKRREEFDTAFKVRRVWVDDKRRIVVAGFKRLFLKWNDFSLTPSIERLKHRAVISGLPSWLTKILNLSRGWISAISHAVIKKGNSIGKSLWKVRFFIIATTLTTLVGANLLAVFTRYPRSNHLSIIRAQNFWPSFPHTSVQLASVYFNLGYEKETLYHLLRAQSNLFFPLAFTAKREAQTIKSQLEMVSSLRKHYEDLAGLENQYPYSWQILLAQAGTAKSLNNEHEAQNLLHKVHWLYPIYTLPEWYEASKSAYDSAVASF